MQTYRPDLIALVAREQNLSIEKATDLVVSVLTNIVTLAERGPLTIYEFGRFEFVRLAPRTVKTAINREGPVDVPERLALRFKPSPSLINRVGE